MEVSPAILSIAGTFCPLPGPRLGFFPLLTVIRPCRLQPNLPNTIISTHLVPPKLDVGFS